MESNIIDQCRAINPPPTTGPNQYYLTITEDGGPLSFGATSCAQSPEGIGSTGKICHLTEIKLGNISIYPLLSRNVVSTSFGLRFRFAVSAWWTQVNCDLNEHLKREGGIRSEGSGEQDAIMGE